ncbi:MAG: restriction endonuclease [Bacilli bacterium]|nr:restriction endonuclease [Bacilli bacterium]
MNMRYKKGSRASLFLELAQPDEDGYSRWVSKREFVGEYEPLMFKNGGDWCRSSAKIAKDFVLEFDRTETSGVGIDRIRLAGFQDDAIGSQTIRSDIKRYYQGKRCVVLGTSNPEVDHKNGRKNNPSTMCVDTQKLEEFQPLSKAANDAKRQFCKECKRTSERYDATKLGYPISFYAGTSHHDGSVTGCEGCFWYDPVEFRRHLEQKRD